MERKERIKELRILLELTNIQWFGKEKEAISSAIAEAELMERVSGGVEKRIVKYDYECFCNNNDSGSFQCEECRKKEDDILFNSTIDLCNAHWVEKIKGIEEVVSKSNLATDLQVKILTQALTTHLTGKEK